MRRQIVTHLLATYLFALTACTGDSESRPPSSGELLYRQALCASCHGYHGQGAWMGPPLEDLNENWSRDTLQEFIRDPTVLTESDQRLSRLAEKFPTAMAPQSTLSRDQRLEIADWLLSR